MRLKVAVWSLYSWNQEWSPAWKDGNKCKINLAILCLFTLACFVQHQAICHWMFCSCCQWFEFSLMTDWLNDFLYFANCKDMT